MIWKRLCHCFALIVFSLVLTSDQAMAARNPSPKPWSKARKASRATDLEISLVTFSPGNDVPSWFGHSAIVVHDKARDERRLYNYGMFRFDSLMVARFVKGRLEFWVGPSNYRRTLDFYQRQDRDVRIQILNISPDKAQEIAQYLEWNVKLENREYLYHHYNDNCSTRLRDLIDMASSGQFKTRMTTTKARMSLRDHTRRHARWAILDFGMSFAMNSDIDQRITAWDEMFLPGELEKNLANFLYQNSEGKAVPLVKKTIVYYRAQNRKPTPKTPPLLWPFMTLIGLLIGGSSIFLARRYAKDTSNRKLFGLSQMMIGGAFGMAGVLLVLMWAVTDHVISYHNENLLWTSPLLIAGVVLGFRVFRGKPGAVHQLSTLWFICSASAILGFVLKVTPWFGQQNWLAVALMVPVIISLLVTGKIIRNVDDSEQQT